MKRLATAALSTLFMASAYAQDIEDTPISPDIKTTIINIEYATIHDFLVSTDAEENEAAFKKELEKNQGNILYVLRFNKDDERQAKFGAQFEELFKKHYTKEKQRAALYISADPALDPVLVSLRGPTIINIFNGKPLGVPPSAHQKDKVPPMDVHLVQYMQGSDRLAEEARNSNSGFFYQENKP